MNIEVGGILQNMLSIIREDGWAPDGWNLTPPYCLRAAATQAIWTSYPCGEARQQAYAQTINALAETIFCQPKLGLITYWEQAPGRTTTDVEAVLIKTIETLKGVAA